MVAIIVLSAVFAILVIAFVWFFFYSRTLAWGESETRQAILRAMVVIGPMFGVRYKEPRPEPPTIATPAKEEDPPMPGVVLPPHNDE